MGNCANKPLTTEGEAPVTEEKATATTVEEREIEVDQNKVIMVADDVADLDHNSTKPQSLAQMFEGDGKKAEAEGTAKPAEEKPTEPAKIEEVAKAVGVETKYEEAPKPAAEPPKPETSEPKKEEIKPTVAPTVAPAATPTVAPTATPATVEKKVEEKKPVAK